MKIFSATKIATKLASLKLSFILLLSLLAAILIAYNGGLSYVYWLTLPLILLLLNLICAILVNRAFQQNLPLLLFHLTLLVTAVLLLLSRLTYLDAHVELNEGEVFDGKLNRVSQGLLHQYNLKEGDFAHLAIQLDFTPQVTITAVRSRVAISNEAGQQEFVIGEHRPFVIKNYRFYISHNIGYSAIFTWQSFADGKEQTGTINFPNALTNEFSLSNTWTIPETDTELWMLLRPEKSILDEKQHIRLTLPENHHIVVRQDDNRQLLKVGHQLKLPNGLLTYNGLRTWMGFQVHYDPFKSYLLATSLLTVLCLCWFFLQKFNRQSWLSPIKA